ncbi:MAG: class I SAM-dependent methyltransferase [bacterium]|nr:class I SAM-dependent methyltransferase [bacterium]
MPDSYLEEHIAALPENEWRTWSLNSLVLTMLPPRGKILDYGCGSGQLLKRLAKFTNHPLELNGFEISQPLIKQAILNAPDTMNITNQPSLLTTNYFDNIYLLDVIEHIEDDQAVLASLYGTLKPGGRILIAVPAHQSLFHDFDRELGHWRRYDWAELQEKVIAAGFEIEQQRWWNRLGEAVVRYQINHQKERPKTLRAGSRTVAQKIINQALLAWFWLFENRFAPANGLTLIVVACKPN